MKQREMLLDSITLPALTHYADKLPATALPHLGSLAHIGLFLSRTCRRRFLRGLTEIFAHLPADRQRGMQRLLQISELDYEMRCDAVRDASRLRQQVAPEERESICKFFRALWGARALREYYSLLDPYEAEGEDNVESILDGSAFRSGGLVSRLLGNNVLSLEQPAPRATNQKTQRPTYDSKARELRVGDTVIRRYGKFNYHEQILKAFQKAKWNKRIKTPPSFSNYPDRLRETIDQLNTAQKNRPMLVRFRLHEGYVVWDWR